MGRFHDGLMETVIRPGVGEWVGLFECGVGLGDAMKVQCSGTLCRQIGGLALQLFSYFQQVIQGSRVAGKHLQQRAVLAVLFTAGHNSGYERALAMPGLNHAPPL